MFTGADTWLSRASRTDGSDTTDGPPSAWSVSGLCLENERVLSSWCVACGAGKYNGPGDDPALGVDTECDGFGTRDALKAAVDNCLAVDSTGVACCSHGADCGAAGTVEMPDWDVSLVTSMSSLFYNKGSFNADISRWDVSSVTSHVRMFYNAQAFNQDIGTWDHLERHDHEGMFYQADAFNQHLSRWDVSSVTTMRHMFYHANAFNKMPEGWDTSKVTDSYNIFYLQTHGMRGSRAAADSTLPGGGWTRKDNACDASMPPLNGAVGNCTDTLVSGTSCVPTCDTGYRAGGRDVVHRPGTDGGCVHPGRHHQGRAQGGGGRVRRRSAVRDDHAPLGRLARDGHELPVPGQDTIQRGHQPVGDVAGDGRAWYVPWRLWISPCRRQGVDLRRRREHDGDVHGRRHVARALLSRRRARHGGWTAGRMDGPKAVPGERTRRERTVRALHRRRDQSRGR